MTPVVLGCAPWLSDSKLVDALLNSSYRSCIVVSKPHRRSESLGEMQVRLNDFGRPVPKGWLSGLDWVGRPSPDGTPPVVAHSPAIRDEEWEAGHDVDLGPIRLLGWRADRERPPLAHAKLMVFGWHGLWRDVDDFTPEWIGFLPYSVWWGSANFTYASRSSLEWATWSNDRGLTTAATGFLLDLIKMSEPFSLASASEPLPDLTAATDPYDDWGPDEDDLRRIAEYDDDFE